MQLLTVNMQAKSIYFKNSIHNNTNNLFIEKIILTFKINCKIETSMIIKTKIIKEHLDSIPIRKIDKIKILMKIYN